jgi:hypothetical protein
LVDFVDSIPEALLKRDTMTTPIHYQIRCEKDGSSVKASYDLQVPDGGSALLASFNLEVDGKELIDQERWIPGQVRFSGTQFTQLANANKDVTVAFSISSNEGWNAADSDILRGGRVLDDVSFRNV